MPTYAYKCQSCDHLLEIDHPVDAPPPKRCAQQVKKGSPPKRKMCGGKLKRQLYPVAGWLS